MIYISKPKRKYCYKMVQYVQLRPCIMVKICRLHYILTPTNVFDTDRKSDRLDVDSDFCVNKPETNLAECASHALPMSEFEEKTVAIDKEKTAPSSSAANLQTRGLSAPETIKRNNKDMSFSDRTRVEMMANTQNTVRRKTMAEVLREPGNFLSSKRDGQWEEVQRRRLRNHFVGQHGKANTEATSKFKAADLKVPLFISNVHKDTQENDITDYIFAKTREKVNLFKIRTKYDRGYNSFKLLVSNSKLELFLDDKLWPDGITFRRFVNFGKSETDQTIPHGRQTK